MNSLFLKNIFLWILITSCAHEELYHEVSIIHKDTKKDIILKSWTKLVEESINLIKERNYLKNTILNENDIVIWNNGEKLYEKDFRSNNFKNGNKHIYVFLTNNVLDKNCFTKDNIYKLIGGEIEKYKNLFKRYFQFNDNKGVEWNALEEILKLLMKSKELRDLTKNINSDNKIELVRQKIIELTKDNKKYKALFDMIKDNKAIYNILDNSDEWKNFVKSNFENIKKLIEPYTYYDDEEADL